MTPGVNGVTRSLKKVVFQRVTPSPPIQPQIDVNGSRRQEPTR